MSKIMGLDVGSYAIKASIFEGSLGRYSIDGFKSIRISQDERPLVERQEEALELLIKDIGSDIREVVISYPCSELSTRIINLPFSDSSKVNQILPFHIEDQIPFDLDDVKIVYRPLSITENETSILSLISLNRNISEKLDFLNPFGIDPKNIIVDADVMSNFCTQPIQAVIDIGHSKTTCALARDGKTIALRCLHQGGKQILDAISTGFNLDEDEAYEQLTQIHLNVVDPFSAEAIQQTVTSEIKRLITGIKRILISFEDELEIEIDDVLICGGGAQIQGLEELLEEELGVIVNKIQPITPAIEEANAKFALCYLLGKKAAGDTHGRELDLRIDEFAYKGHLAGMGRIIKVAAAIAILMMIGGTAIFFQTHSEQQAEIDALHEKILAKVAEEMPKEAEILTDASQALSLVMTDTQETRLKVERLGSLISDSPPITTLLRDISTGVPAPQQARIDVSELIIGKTSINLKAETDGYEAATKIEKALQSKPTLKRAVKADEKKTRNGVRFSIQIPLGEEKTEEEG